MHFARIFQEGLKPKNEGHTKFYKCRDLIKKSISNVGRYLLDFHKKYLLVWNFHIPLKTKSEWFWENSFIFSKIIEYFFFPFSFSHN